MKRRNAETGKMRRSVKRTKITEGTYGKYYPQNAYLVYLKFILVWATVIMADHMVNFRFEFLWPFSMMIRSVYDSFKYQGLSFSVFFICIVLSSDVVCFFLIPMQYIFFAAGTYVWVHYLWYSLADKGVCVPTVLLCCVIVYMEGLWRDERDASWRPLAAHCVGYPAASLGFNLKSYVEHRLRARRQRRVRSENEFYFQILRDALPESAQEHSHKESTNNNNNSTAATASATESTNAGSGVSASETRHMNGTVKRRTKEQNGHCTADSSGTSSKSEKHEKQSSAQAKAHAHSNGNAHGAAEEDDKHDHSKGSAKNVKCEKKDAISIKEEKRKHKNKDKDSDSHKSTEQTKEQNILKEIESTNSKENVIRNHKDSTNNKEREREKERDKEREREREREKEREKEREREREKEQKTVRDYQEELKLLKEELAASRVSEAEARRLASAAAAADRRHRTDYTHLKQAHATLQHKFDSVSAKVSVWRGGERAALERRLSEERRARALAEHHLLRARHNGNGNTTPSKSNNSGECESEWCKSKASAHEAETSALRAELRRAVERADALGRDLQRAREQVRSLEASRSECSSPCARANSSLANGTPPGHNVGQTGHNMGQTGHNPGQTSHTTVSSRAYRELHERAAHLERSLSAETRVKLDLLSALGDAKRHMTIQEGLISRQEKEIEELKAQMVAVLPSLPVSRAHTNAHSRTLPPRRADSSPLDPNASVYTPKQLCTDA